MAAGVIYYYVLNLSYIFTFSSYYYCSSEKFQGCELPNGEENYYYICWFKLSYYPAEIEKIFHPKKIADNYLSMKEDLKRCVNFDPSINNSWNYDFKFNWRDSEGTKYTCYLKDNLF